MDADLKDYFGSVDHEHSRRKKIADSKVLKLIQQMLKAGYEDKGRQFVWQGGVVSPTSILLTPFDKEMRRQGYQLTRWADDWIVTCRTRAEADHALARAAKILEKLGVTLNRDKTRIVHITHGFEFLGFKSNAGKRSLSCPSIGSNPSEPVELSCHSHTEGGRPIQRSDQELDTEVRTSAVG